MPSPNTRPLTDAACYRWKYVAGVVLCLVGITVGLYLPDIDQIMQIPSLFVHRSIVSHSALLPLLLMGMVVASSRHRPEGPTTQLTHPHAAPRLRLFTLGLCTALAVHFCFDLFPYGWRGYSLIHIPLLGRLSGAQSFAWLLASAITCLYLGSRLLRNLFDLLFTIGCLGAAYGLAAAQDSHAAVYVLLVLTIVAPLAFILPRPRPSA